MREATAGQGRVEENVKPKKKGYNGGCGALTAVIALKNKKKKC